MKAEITIRCNRCDAIESVVTEAWAQLRTSCGCDGPYRIIERKLLPEEDPPKASSDNKGESTPAATQESAPTEPQD